MYFFFIFQVVRQNEADLITAVHELCDGTPSEETILLLKSLDRPLPENINVTCLYGTNFDVNYINHEKLEDMAGEELVFKAKDEGMFIKKEDMHNYQCDNYSPKTLATTN